MRHVDPSPDGAQPAQAPSAARRSIDWRLVSRYSARLALTVALAWLAFWTLAMLGVWQRTTSDEAPNHGAASTAASGIPLAEFLDGHWSFGDSGSATGILKVRNEQLEERLMAVPAGPVDRTAPGQSTAASPDQEMLAWLRGLDAKPEQRDGFKVYRYQGPGLRAAAFVGTRNGGERLEVVRLAADDGQGGWLLIENQSAVAAPAASASQDTLPLPPTAKREGTRRDRQGRVLAEMVSFQGDFPPLRQFWEQCGWKVDEVSTTQPDVRHLRCAKDALAWHIWVRQEAGAGTLLIVLEPAE